MSEAAEASDDGRKKEKAGDDGRWIVKGPIIMLTRAAAVIGLTGLGLAAGKRLVRSLGKRR